MSPIRGWILFPSRFAGLLVPPLLVIAGVLLGWIVPVHRVFPDLGPPMADSSMIQAEDPGRIAYMMRIEASSEYRWLLLVHDYGAAAELLSECSESRIHHDDLAGYLRTLWYSVGTAPDGVVFPDEVRLATRPGLASDTLLDTLAYDRGTSELLDLGKMARFAKSTTLSDDEITTIVVNLGLHRLSSDGLLRIHPGRGSDAP